MGKNIQKYWLEFASRAHKEVSVETKHTAFFEGLSSLPERWGLGSRPMPPVPEFNGGILAVCTLTKLLGVSKSDIMYEYRRDFPDDSQYDDRIAIIFHPSQVDMGHLVYTVIPAYIEAFDAYRVEYFDDALVPVLAQRPKIRHNKRNGVSDVGPISFFDDLLCQRAFGLHASAVVDLFNGKIEHAAVLHGGAYLVGSSRVLSFEESQRLSKEMKEHLRANSRR
jgi:hypothetical protein